MRSAASALSLRSCSSRSAMVTSRAETAASRRAIRAKKSAVEGACSDTQNLYPKEPRYGRRINTKSTRSDQISQPNAVDKSCSGGANRSRPKAAKGAPLVSDTATYSLVVGQAKQPSVSRLVNPVGRQNRDHLVKSARTMRSAVGSTIPSIRNRVPLGKATTILPAGSGQSATGRSTPGRSLTSMRAKVAIA